MASCRKEQSIYILHCTNHGVLCARKRRSRLTRIHRSADVVGPPEDWLRKYGTARR